MKKIVFIAAALLMAGCSREFVEKIYDVNYEPTNRFANNLAELPGQFEKDTAALDALINSFSGNIQKRWGKKEIKYAGKSNYVKYIDNYLSRAEVDFRKGVITIETVSPTEPQKHLKDAIVTTLLTPDDPAHVDLFSSKGITLEGQPFLY
ncbi:murein transglycosylase domain-containing protein, partial [Vibrio parahaemolyticus]